MGGLGSPQGVAGRGRLVARWDPGVELLAKRAENLFGPIGMRLATEDFDRVGAKLVAEFVEWVLRGRAL